MTGHWRDDDDEAEDVGVEVGLDPAAVGVVKCFAVCMTAAFISLMLALAVPDGGAADYQIKRLRADIDRLETQVKALTERTDKSQSQRSVAE